MEKKEYSIISVVLILLLFIELLFDLIFFTLNNYNIFTRNIFIFLIMHIVVVIIIWISYIRKRFSQKYKDIELNSLIDLILGIGLFIIDILITLYTAFSFSEIFMVLYFIMFYVLTQQKRRSKFSLVITLGAFIIVLIYHFFIPFDPAIKYFILE